MAMRALLKRFWKDSGGAALVEFAIVLPIMMLTFAMIIEGSRLMWSYQVTISAVRDATRYLGRVTPRDICDGGSTASITDFNSTLNLIVSNSAGGTTIFPSGITLDSVVPSLSCPILSLGADPTPIAQVTATITVTFPFSGVFSFAGGGDLASMTKTISDQTRVFGL